MKDFIFQDILFAYEKIDSTNSDAIKKIQEGQGGLCFVVQATTQKHGRGRLEREWASSFTGNIYMTIAFEETLISQELAKILPLYTAFSVIKSINSNLIKYKWPNDLMVEDKKFCGILIQKYKNFYIVGIGVNIVDAPPYGCFLKNYNLHTSTLSIFNSFKEGTHYNNITIINFLSNHFFKRFDISINKGEFTGDFKEINSDGNLILRSNNKDVTIKFGDIS